jgi:hypothetical protein
VGARRKAGALNRGGSIGGDGGVTALAVVRRTREGRPQTDRWAERRASGQYGADDVMAHGAARTLSVAGCESS